MARRTKSLKGQEVCYPRQHASLLTWILETSASNGFRPHSTTLSSLRAMLPMPIKASSLSESLSVVPSTPRKLKMLTNLDSVCFANGYTSHVHRSYFCIVSPWNSMCIDLSMGESRLKERWNIQGTLSITHIVFTSYFPKHRHPTTCSYVPMPYW